MLPHMGIRIVRSVTTPPLSHFREAFSPLRSSWAQYYTQILLILISINSLSSNIFFVVGCQIKSRKLLFSRLADLLEHQLMPMLARNCTFELTCSNQLAVVIFNIEFINLVLNFFEFIHLNLQSSLSTAFPFFEAAKKSRLRLFRIINRLTFRSCVHFAIQHFSLINVTVREVNFSLSCHYCGKVNCLITNIPFDSSFVVQRFIAVQRVKKRQFSLVFAFKLYFKLFDVLSENANFINSTLMPYSFDNNIFHILSHKVKRSHSIWIVGCYLTRIEPTIVNNQTSKLILSIYYLRLISSNQFDHNKSFINSGVDNLVQFNFDSIFIFDKKQVVGVIGLKGAGVIDECIYLNFLGFIDIYFLLHQSQIKVIPDFIDAILGHFWANLNTLALVSHFTKVYL